MDNPQIAKKLEKTLEEVRSTIGSNSLDIQVDFQPLSSMESKESQHASEFFSGDGYHITMKNGFKTLCKVESGKAWLSRFQQIKVTLASAPQQNVDVVAQAIAAEPVLSVNFSLRTSRNLRTAYNPRALEEAVTQAIPQLKAGQDMDKITQSGKLLKTQAEIQKVTENPALMVDFDMFSISNMADQAECHHATEWITGDGYFITMKNAFASLCKVESGKAWLSTVTMIAVKIISTPEQNVDVQVLANVQQPVLNLTFSLRTSRNLRTGYNPRALEEAVTQAIPQMKTGQDMDKIKSSGKLEKALTEVRKSVENDALMIDFDMFSISNMADEAECHHATEWITGDGYFITMKNAFASLCKVESGKAWLRTVTMIAVKIISTPEQNVDVQVLANVQQPVLNLTFSLRTSRNLRTGYNPRALEEAVTQAIPQMKTGQDMDKIKSSGKLEKALTEVRKSVENDALMIDFDMFSISNMADEAECHHATEWITGDGYFITMKNAFASLCKVESGKAWLRTVTMISVKIISTPEQNVDVQVLANVQQPVLNLTFSLRTSRNLRTAYNPRALEEAVTQAIPQIKTGQDMDKITQSGKLLKTLTEVRKVLENDALMIDFDLFSVSNIANAEECHSATEWVSGDGYFITMKNAFQTLCRNDANKSRLQKITQINTKVASNPQQNDDVEVVAKDDDTTLDITFSLRTSRNLRTGYNPRALEEGIEDTLPSLKVNKEASRGFDQFRMRPSTQSLTPSTHSLGAHSSTTERDLKSLCFCC